MAVQARALAGLPPSSALDEFVAVPSITGLPPGLESQVTPWSSTGRPWPLDDAVAADNRRHAEEPGKRQPEGPTRAYLLVIDRAPKAVQQALLVA